MTWSDFEGRSMTLEPQTWLQTDVPTVGLEEYHHEQDRLEAILERKERRHHDSAE